MTLLGDAAHPMYPVGSNGASQAILDAAALAHRLASTETVEEAFAAYDAERRPSTADIVRTNRRGGPEGVIDLVEARAPHGFDDGSTARWCFRGRSKQAMRCLPRRCLHPSSALQA